MSVSFSPARLDFGMTEGGFTGPNFDSTSDDPFQEGRVGILTTIGGLQGIHTDAPAGNITASIHGDNTHFKIVRVTVYRVMAAHGIRYMPVGRSDGVTPLAVAAGQAVSIQIMYDLTSVTGGTSGSSFNATLVIHGDTPAWAPDSVIPLTVSVFPVRTIKTTFGAQSTTIPQGGHGDIPITVTNVTGPVTDVTYDLFPPSTSVGGVPMDSGLVMNPDTVSQVPKGGTKTGSLGFSLPPRTMPPGNYPISISVGSSTFAGIPLTDSPVPDLTLIVLQGQTSVAFLNPETLEIAQGASVIVPVIVTVAGMSPINWISISLVPSSLPPSVTISSFSDSLSDNPHGLPSPMPPHNVDAGGSRIFNLTLNVDRRATPGQAIPLTMTWSSGVGSFFGGVLPQASGSIIMFLSIYTPRRPKITAQQQNQTIVLSGDGFELHKSITVLVEVQNTFGSPDDSRQGSFTLQSTPTGSLPANTFNPVNLFGGQSRPIAHGELVSVTAADTDVGTLQSGQPGVSNTVQFNWQ